MFSTILSTKLLAYKQVMARRQISGAQLGIFEDWDPIHGKGTLKHFKKRYSL